MLNYSASSLAYRFCGLSCKLIFLGALAFFAKRAECSEEETHRLKVSRHLVTIERMNDVGDWTFLGTGTYAKLPSGHNVVITAQHVVDSEMPLRICGDIRRQDCVISVLFEQVNSDADIAYIYNVESLNVLPTKIKENSIRTGDNVTFVSLPLGALVIAPGVIAGPSGPESYRMLGYCDRGSSGGGLFDEKGRLVGVISAMFMSQIDNDLGLEMLVPAHSLCNIYEL